MLVLVVRCNTAFTKLLVLILFCHKVTEKLPLRACFFLMLAVVLSALPSGAMKKNLTAEQMKEDLLALGMHP